ncbi:hypothetical protein E4U58_001853 [Claviceps cyperi]|nr:hypothetical protein E4U58_001853 [Claviceps cyperi]
MDALACLASVASLERQTMSPVPQPQPQTGPGVQIPHRRGPWLMHEDELLRCMVEDKGAKNWAVISSHVGSRSPKQCRERWHQSLDPRLNHDPITEEEGQFITNWVIQKGPQWAEIARRLEGRSDNAVKNWYNGVQNRNKRRGSALESQRQKASQREDSRQVSLPVTNSALPLPKLPSIQSLQCPSLSRSSNDAQTKTDWHLSRLPSPRSDHCNCDGTVNRTTSPAAQWHGSSGTSYSREPPRPGKCVWYKGGVPIVD